MIKYFMGKTILSIVFWSLLQTSAHSESLIELYRISLNNYPSFRSFEEKNKSFKNDIKAFSGQRFLNLVGDITGNIQIGQSPSTTFSISNTLDIFNKKGFNIQQSDYEILKNYYLQNVERKNIFVKLTNEYLNIQKNNSLLKIHQDFLRFVEQNINVVEIGIKGGLYPATDINRWNIEKFTKLSLIETDKMEIQKSSQQIQLISNSRTKLFDELSEKNYSKISLEKIIKNSPELYVYDTDKLKFEVDIQMEDKAWYPYLQINSSNQLSGANSSSTTNNQSKNTTDTNTIGASFSFNLIDGGRSYRIESIKNKINSLAFDRKTEEINLKVTYNRQLIEIQAQKNILNNLKQSINISENNLNKMIIGYKKNFVDLTTIINLNRDLLTAKESYINLLANINQNYETLLHLEKGDIFQ